MVHSHHHRRHYRSPPPIDPESPSDTVDRVDFTVSTAGTTRSRARDGAQDSACSSIRTTAPTVLLLHPRQSATSISGTGDGTPARRHHGLSMFLVERGLPGFTVSRALHKTGMLASDTAELAFEDTPVPAENLLGGVEGKGFSQMMEQLPYERLTVGVTAVATAERAVAITTQHVKERTAFGKPLLDFQNTRFRLAECKAAIHTGRVFANHCIELCIQGRLDPVTAATAKYWLTECQFRIIDDCLQLHGGYGYMDEYPIARMWTDCRMQRIGGGTNEIMKEIIGSSV